MTLLASGKTRLPGHACATVDMPMLSPGRGGDRTSEWPAPKTGTPPEFHAALFPWGALRQAGAAGAKGIFQGASFQHRSPALTDRPGCRGALWPGGHATHTPRPGATRASAGACQWPEHVLRRVSTGERGLVPRGTLFESYIHDDTEPRRNGTYQFCVVGVDLSAPEQPGYFCWEPTGRFDRSFAFHELDQKLSLERYGRSVTVGARPLGQRAGVQAEAAHRKEGLSVGRVVRWPDFAEAGALVHGRLLPDVDERGRPVLSCSCRFPPRHSVDLLGPMLWTWQQRFPCAGADGVQPRILVLDGSGRLAKTVQDEFPAAEVVAADDPPRFCRATLRSHRDRSHFPVCIDGVLDCSTGTLHLSDEEFDVVVLPFVLQRLAGADESRFLALVREALRVSRGLVLLAEDALPASAGQGDCFRRWKSLFQADWRASVLHDGALRSDAVGDHFLAAAPKATSSWSSSAAPAAAEAIAPTTVAATTGALSGATAEEGVAPARGSEGAQLSARRPLSAAGRAAAAASAGACAASTERRFLVLRPAHAAGSGAGVGVCTGGGALPGSAHAGPQG